MHMDSWAETEVSANGITLHCWRTGGDKKPLLVLAHGFSDNGLCWYRAAKQLAEKCDVLMFDARNHGLSSRAPAGAEAMAKDLAALIKAVSPDRPVHLLGHSMGASTVASVAARWPQLVKSALLEDPPWMVKDDSQTKEAAAEAAKKRGEEFRKFLELIRSRSPEAAQKLGKTLNPDWHEDDLLAWAESKQQVSDEAAKGLSFPDWRTDGPNIAVPTLLIYTDGKRDGMLTKPVVDELLEGNQQLSAAEIPGAGHNIRRENFQDYMRAVEAFLDITCQS
jgi:pimeloyl-ACP methyl ester carboxylesterase